LGARSTLAVSFYTHRGFGCVEGKRERKRKKERKKERNKADEKRKKNILTSLVSMLQGPLLLHQMLDK
jgi:hypothetical protein